VLSFTIVMLAIIPSRLIVPGMTDLGRPALIVGFLMWCWWVVSRISPHLVLVGPQPMRWAVCVYLVAMLISYAVGFLRGLSAIELNGADRAMLFTAVFTGVILMAADGIPNWDRLRGVLRVFVWSAGAMAVIGLLQFGLALDLTQYLTLPGLQAKGWAPDLQMRGTELRVASTTAHYIEFSTVMALALPFAIHFARFAEQPRRRKAFITAALLIAAAIPVTISRTGLLAVVVTMFVLVPVWGWRMRYNMLSCTIGLFAALTVVKPSLAGTLRWMVVGANEDTSISARTDRYPLVYHYFVQRPWLGRGTGTWLHPQYQILDNYWFTLVLSNGLLGVAALLTLHVTGIVLASLALRRATNEEDRHLAAVLIATQLIAIVVAATFDSMSFSTYATALSLTIGCCGTVWRFTHPARTVRTSAPRWSSQ
jgi:O-antigen ligase